MREVGVDLVWRKSWHSAGEGQCVEIADIPGGVAVRDSKTRGVPPLRFASPAWDAFLAAVKGGEFDIS